MARGRFISRTLGESRKFAALSSDVHRLIYVLVLPWVDREGRFEADPVVIGSKCLLRLMIEPSTIQAWLEDAHKVGLIKVYEAKGVRVLEVVDFLEHNKPHHKEPDSDLPPPTEGEGGTPSSTPPSKHGASMAQARAKHEPRMAQDWREEEVEVEVEVEEEEEVEHPPPQSSLDVGALSAPAGGGGDGAGPDETLTSAQRADADQALHFAGLASRRSTTGVTSASMLRARFPLSKRAFDRLQGVYHWQEGDQYVAVAEKLLHMCESHGDGAVSDALESVLLSGVPIKQPIPYVEAVLKRAAEAPGGPSDFDFEADAKRLFGEVN